MATINLATKYAQKLDERYKTGSYTDQWCGSNFNWEGANTVKVWTLTAGELTDYDPTAAANRFGTPSEVEDELGTYTLRCKRSFSKVMDVTNVQDQMFVKKANAYLKQMWDERYVPEIDRHRLRVWSEGAGLGMLNGTALTSATVIKAILNAHAAMDDADVPAENRVCFVRSDIAVECKLATALANNQSWTDKTIRKGKLGELNGAPIVSVAKNRMPAGVEFILKHKQATADPMKLRMLRANDSAPGYAGTLMEGLCRYDAFVLSQKADGIYVYAQNGMCALPVVSQSGNSVTITCATSGAQMRYTTDGTNPKTSTTALTYASAITLTQDAKIRVYASKSGLLSSPISALDAVKV